jgi:S1-C subfamily serine protease
MRRCAAPASLFVPALALACAAQLACGASRAPTPVAVARPVVAARPAAPSPADATVVERARPPGPLTRAEVEPLLAAGLGPLLARVHVTPVLARGRFVGFRLDDALDLPAWRAAGADIRRGDVIVRVNGVRIERPEQALWAFERLRIATAIELDLLRDGAPTTVRSPILETRDARVSAAAPR